MAGRLGSDELLNHAPQLRVTLPQLRNLLSQGSHLAHRSSRCRLERPLAFSSRAQESVLRRCKFVRTVLSEGSGVRMAKQSRSEGGGVANSDLHVASPWLPVAGCCAKRQRPHITLFGLAGILVVHHRWYHLDATNSACHLLYSASQAWVRLFLSKRAIVSSHRTSFLQELPSLIVQIDPRRLRILLLDLPPAAAPLHS